MKDAAIPVWQRVTGLALLVVALIFMRNTAPHALIEPVLGVMLIAGALLITRAVLAVALATLFLAWAHTDLGAADVMAARFYPALAVAGAVLTLVSLSTRFRKHMRDTHAKRWAPRTNKHQG